MELLENIADVLRNAKSSVMPKRDFMGNTSTFPMALTSEGVLSISNFSGIQR